MVTEMELERWQVIKEFVILGQGIALVPGFSLEDDHSRFAVGQVRHRFPSVSYGVNTRAGGYLSPQARSLIAAIRTRHAHRAVAGREPQLLVQPPPKANRY